MSKVNQKQNLAKKYASSFFQYIDSKNEKSSIDLSIPVYLQNQEDQAPNLSLVYQNIRLLRYLIISNNELLTLLSNIEYSSEKKLELIFSIVPKLHPILKAFLIVLAERNQLSLLSDIFEEYQNLYNTSSGLKYIKIISRVPIPKESKVLLRKFLLKNYSGSFKRPKVFLDFLISDQILGGFIMVDGLSRIDISLKYKLQELLKTL